MRTITAIMGTAVIVSLVWAGIALIGDHGGDSDSGITVDDGAPSYVKELDEKGGRITLYQQRWADVGEVKVTKTDTVRYDHGNVVVNGWYIPLERIRSVSIGGI